MTKKPHMEKARPTRQKLSALPDVPPYLQSELDMARKAWRSFIDEYQVHPMRWGLASFEEIARPYASRVDLAHSNILEYLQSTPEHFTSGLVFLALDEYKDLILSEHQSRIGKQVKDSKRPSEDGSKWDGKRIAEAARIAGYSESTDKKSIVSSLAARSQKSETVIRRALREHGLSKSYSKRKPT
ncbi:hypothetical protein GIW56_09395 [Pseudomonas gessardii]|uniref:Uncharacterized protein n=1 Tax=Pseudomonas gessardii TaxID=78544 RepID=A0ABS9F3T9_9PSED|nr:hypothetical protein [Pseudomonas gessardii]MCF4977728.1 hypothetical protein [Pseudomonas gessardii]MCF4993617.1 hypothetical protein [Pseudomonas gessardii]MCF5087958.1 hypothetical protein [Pseudomonas gessardii]MCF5097605.1 hypothetical protein [Pseudomonas gessardii]MCF5107052.1 hypothetical protein [Pseudomonas gessardii]